MPRAFTRSTQAEEDRKREQETVRVYGKPSIFTARLGRSCVFTPIGGKDGPYLIS